MYKLTLDKGKNRIYILIKDKIRGNEMTSYIKELKELIDCTEKNFTVCADLREAHISVLRNNANFNPIREYGLKKGIKDSVKIMTKGQIYVYKTEISKNLVNIFETKDEAENFLSSKN